MAGLLTTMVSLLVFGVVVFVHELGHFLAARHCGIRVEEFSIGFGPAIYTTTKNGTTYTIRLLPLGGYNLFTAPPDPGQETEEGERTAQPAALARRPRPEKERRSNPLFPLTVANQDYEQAPPWRRFFVTMSGALMNFVLGIAVLLVLVSTSTLGGNTVAEFFPNATSNAAGLAVGDSILQVDGTPTPGLNELYPLLMQNPGPRTLTVLRGGQVLTLPDVTISEGVDGELVNGFDFYIKRLPKTPQNLLRVTAQQFKYYSTAILGGFAKLFSGSAGVEDLSGPVGVVSAVNQAVQYGWRDVLSLMALLTINLGIFNLLPIPALDGCKLLFFAWEGITGHAVPQRVQIIVNTVGMVALLWLILFVTMQDIGRIFG